MSTALGETEDPVVRSPAEGRIAVASAQGVARPETGRILLAEGERALRRALGLFLLRSGYEVDEAGEGTCVLARLEEGGIDVLLLDLALPGGGGLALLEAVRERCPTLEVVALTGRIEAKTAYEGLRRGAFDVLRKPFLFDEAAVVVRRALERGRMRAHVLELERMRERELASESHTMQVLGAMATLLDAKSKFTREHSDRVSRHAVRLAHALGLPPEQVRRVAFGAKVHDIGKVGVPDAILDKPGPLTEEEREAIKRHPSIGEECLAPLPAMHPFVCMVGGHHENWDGSGYPRAIVGTETPLEARIVKVADYYDAITSVRPYRDPMTRAQALETLLSQRGVALDRELVDAFLANGLDGEFAGSA